MRMSEKGLIVALWWSWLWALLTMLHIDHMAMIILTVVMSIDFVTWVIASWINNKEDVESRTMIKWAIKKISLIVRIFLASLLAKYIWIDPTIILNLSFSVFIFSEAYSVISNIYNIQSWNKLPESRAIEKFIEFMSKWINKMLEAYIKKTEDFWHSIKKDDKETI